MHMKTPTCFHTQMPSSGSYYEKGVQANLLICVFVHCSWKVTTVDVNTSKITSEEL